MNDERITINMPDGLNRLINVIGTLLMCGAVGLVGYALAQRGWVEIAATAVTMFLFQLTRMMIANGLIDLSEASPRFEKDDFTGTRGFIQTFVAEYREWQARSPLWRLAALAIGYTITFMICRWLLSIGLTIFSNQWVAMAAASLLGALIIAPNQIGDLLKKMQSKEKTKEADAA